jgi:uncharacterized membrane protein YcaP (DUF421 family)
MLFKIAIRVLFGYFFLLVIIRLSGKRTLSEATSFDFVLSLILGDLIDDLIWAEVPAGQFVVAAGILVSAHIATSLLCRANDSCANWIEGTPTLVIRNGLFARSGARRERMNEKDLAAALRQEGIELQEEVKRGWIEKSGELSILKNPWAKPAQKSDLDAVRRMT